VNNLSIPELGTLLDEQLRRLGPDHADTLMTRHVLAREIAFQGGAQQAIPLYEDLIRDRERVLGAYHRDTLSSRHNLADCHAKCDRPELAIDMYRELIPALEQSLGVDDLDTFHTRQQLAVSLSLAGRVDESVEEFKRLLSDISTSGQRRRNEYRFNRRILLDIAREHGVELGDENRESQGVVIDPVPDSDEPAERPSVLELKLGRGLASRAAEILDEPTEAVEEALARDAKIVGRRIIGRDDPAIGAAVFSSLGSDPPADETDGFLGVIRHLVASANESAGRVASQVALALVDVANTAASLDRTWEVHEEEAIDALRSELRSILGNRMDTTSDAQLEFEKSFEGVVGLGSVRQQLLSFVTFIMDRKRRSLRGGPEDAPRLHLAFVGNPGTGKTSVARIYARLLQQLGLVQSDNFVETDKSGLVGEYIGQTERRTSAVIDGADPGVLFIDEAYALNDSHVAGKGYGEQALEVIIKAMEDRRESLIVVLAGYGKEIEDLMSVNPGLRSRIATVIEFPDYSEDELEEIAVRFAAKRNLRLEDGARVKVRAAVGAMRTRPDFGNARDVESLLDWAQRNQLMRLAPLGDLATESERRVLIASDVPDDIVTEKRKVIGFM